MKQKPIALLVAVAALLLVGCRSEQVESVLGDVLPLGGQNTAPLSASGTIQADEVRISSEIGGQIAEVHANKGESVRAGDVLAVLDASAITDQIAEAEAQVRAAEAELRIVQSAPHAEDVAVAQAAVSVAEAQREGTHAAWQRALDAIQNPQEIDGQIIEAQTQIQLAEQAVILAQAQLEREKLLSYQKPQGSQEREAADLQVQAAKKAVAAAQADQATAEALLTSLQQIRAQPLALIAQANTAQGQYDISVEDVAVTEAQLADLVAGATPQEIAVAKRAVRLAEAQAQVLRATRDLLTLRSPVDGVVLDQVLRGGELAAPGATILTVADLQQLTLVVYVPVAELGRVQIGKLVQVQVDSHPGQVFGGRVKAISDEPEFTPRNVATKEERLNTFYAVEIELPNEQDALRPGMPADAQFE